MNKGAEDPEDAFFRLSPFLGMLRKELSSLPSHHQVAFAAYCCERLYPFYEALARAIGTPDAPILRRLVDRIWQHSSGKPIEDDENARLLAETQAIRLGEEASCDEWDGGVDAVGTTALALQACRNDPAGNGARAGGNVLNRVHQQLMDEMAGRNHLLSASDTAQLVQQIEQHPRMKEMQQQLLETISFLRGRPSLGPGEIEHLRSEASRAP